MINDQYQLMPDEAGIQADKNGAYEIVLWYLEYTFILLMKYKLIVLLLAVGFVSNAGAQTTSFTQRDFNPLQWMPGLWKMETPKGTYYEDWKLVTDSLLKGHCYKINGSDTVVLEDAVISLEGTAIFFTPVVKDQNNEQPVPFRLISKIDHRYVFENKEHDFPQRVIYDISIANVLRARIEGNIEGKEKSADFNYSRVK